MRKIPFCSLKIRLRRGIMGILHSLFSSLFLCDCRIAFFSQTNCDHPPPSFLSFLLDNCTHNHCSFARHRQTVPSCRGSHTRPGSVFSSFRSVSCFFPLPALFFCSKSYSFPLFLFFSSSYVPISSSFSIFPTVLMFLFCFIFFLPMFCLYFSSLSLFSPSTFSLFYLSPLL